MTLSTRAKLDMAIPRSILPVERLKGETDGQDARKVSDRDALV